MSYEAAIFFDNDARQINAVKCLCPLVKLVKIPESRHSMIPFNDPHFQHLYPEYRKNPYFQRIENIETADAYDPHPGIQHTHFEVLQKWLQDTRGTKRALIVDWDRTITMFEGMFLFPDISLEDTLTYLVGGPARLDFLRMFFLFAALESVDIVILTNNKLCPSSAYNALVSTLLPGHSFKCICSAFSAKGHKGRALQMDPELKKLCGYADACVISGGRTRTRRRIRRRHQ